jgi:chromate transporter
MTLPEMTRVFARIGVLSFGGPAAQIALMHKELVDERPWLTEEQFLNALSFCMLLPGPEAMQLATYAGWRLHGTIGGLIAGLLFIIPGACVVLGLSVAYAFLGSLPLVAALFLGVKATVVIIVIEALLKVSKRALKSRAAWIIAALAFVGIFVLSLPFPLIIAGAALYGALGAKGPATSAPAMVNPRSLRTIAIGLALWWAPVVLLWVSGAEFLTRLALFFSKLAVVTFGGAYAVLAYMAQQVVGDYGWLDAAQMMDGLGLAETTPGPLILVTEFVGFMAGFGTGGLGTALLAAIVTLWVTFAPCFLWIFAGAPYLDWIATRPRLTGALQAITAAVVGVILNLTVWFALHVFFGTVTQYSVFPLHLWLPDPATLDLKAVTLAITAGILLLRLHISLPRVLGLMALAGGGLLWL